MKFALANDERLEAKPGLTGICPGCDKPMVAKCGEVKVWHWAHAGTRMCDPWWENETEWHRKWKGHFPVEWQERIQYASDGEKHIADVKTGKDWVLEFQHSYLKPEERRVRTAFYPKLVWIIDGNRRPRLKTQFFKTLVEMNPINQEPTIRKVFLGFSALLEEWVEEITPIIFDFGEESPLWCLMPTGSDMWVHVAAISREDFIELHRNSNSHDFAEYINKLKTIIANYDYRQKQMRDESAYQFFGRSGRYSYNQARARSRRRF